MIGVFLTIFYTVVIAFAVILFSAYFWEWFYSGPTGQDETYYVRTPDGWRLALHRYRPNGPPVGRPVILCHGLCSNRYVFDLPGVGGLAPFLRNMGREVWVAELRGSGMSDHPSLFMSDAPYSWDFEDHLNHDVPTIIGFVQRETGSEKVHWIGHSMGGMLILAYLARQTDAGLASAVTLGSPADFSWTPHDSLKKLMSLKEWIQKVPIFPVPFLAGMSAPLYPWTSGYMAGMFNADNIDEDAAKKMLALGSQLISSTKIWITFAGFFDNGGFVNQAGKPYLTGLEDSRVPLTLIGGGRDLLAPEQAVTAACENLPHAAERKCVIASKSNGYAEDYGHVDLVLGSRVLDEIYPLIASRLEAHDA